MKLRSPGEPHLTYCTNIHPGESWPEVRANLARYVPAVRERVAPGRPFGVGLRLSAQAAAALAREETFEDLLALLREHRLYVHTLNGFPYGRFHGEPVKEAVYLPDWLDERRLDYTNRLASLLAELLPPDQPALEGCISTVPGAFRARVTGAAEVERMVELLLRHAAVLHRVAERRGRVIVLALEPEPCCYLETIAEAVRFFEERLCTRAALARFAALAGIEPRNAETVLRRHLGVCLDVCHMAVEFEDAQSSLEALRAAGIRIGKIQLSAGLRVRADGGAGGALAALREFADSVYLHQVVERRDGAYRRFTDLPEALETLGQGKRGRSQFQGDRTRPGVHVPENDSDPFSGAGPREWRVHFHVPLFLRELGPFGNTQEQLEATLRLLRERAYTQHLEVETYTWDVLPAEYRRDDIVTSIARELGWVLERLPA